MGEEETFGSYPVWFVVVIVSFLIAFIILVLLTTDLLRSLMFVGV